MYKKIFSKGATKAAAVLGLLEKNHRVAALISRHTLRGTRTGGRVAAASRRLRMGAELAGVCRYASWPKVRMALKFRGSPVLS